MEQYLILLQDGIAYAGVWFVVLFLFIENIPGVGLIAPGLTILVLSGFFNEMLVSHPGYLYLIAWCTIVVADNLWYWLGYFGGSKSTYLQSLAARSPNIDTLLTKQPLWALVTYQFMPYFRMFLPFSLGLYRLSPLYWLGISMVGSALYVGVFLSIGVIGSAVLQDLVSVESITANINRILVVFALIYGAFLLFQYKKLRTKVRNYS